MNSVVTYTTKEEHRIAVMGSIAQTMLAHNQLRGIPRTNAEQAVREWEQQRQDQLQSGEEPVRKRKAGDDEQDQDKKAMVTVTPQRVKKARGSKPCIHLSEAEEPSAARPSASDRPREGATTPVRTLFSA